MSRYRSKVIYRGTSRELAEHADGYSGNGLSVHTRHVAHGGRVQVDTVEDLKADLRRARIRASRHPVRLVRQRAGEDAQRLEAQLKRLGVDTRGTYGRH